MKFKNNAEKPKQTRKRQPTWPVLKRLLSVLAPYKGWITVLVILQLAGGLISVGTTKLVSTLLQNVVDGNWDHFLAFLIFAFVGYLLQVPQTYYATLLGGRYGQLVLYHLRERSAEALSNLTIDQVGTHHSGDLLSRTNSDLNSLQDFAQSILPYILYLCVNWAVITVFLFYTSWKLTLVSLCCLPPITLLMTYLGKRMDDFWTEDAEANAYTEQVEQDIMGGLMLVKAYGLESEMIRRENIGAQKILAVNKKTHHHQTLVIQPVMFFMRFLPKVVLLCYGGWQVYKGSLELGGLLAFVMLVDIFLEPMNNAGYIVAQFQNGIAKSRRLFEMWDMPAERLGGAVAEKTEGVPVLEFEAVSFGYSPEQTVLRDVSFRVYKGETVAMAGASGCGKSTAVQLAMGFYAPQSGSVRIYGMETGTWDLRKMRENISWVGQDTYLFPKSIYENVKCVKPDATDEELETVFREANIWDFIQSLPNGWHEQVGERGVRLSGGQRQRVAIARALLRDAPLLLLDEATSALDTQAEREVQTALETLMKDRATLVIAHRLSAIRSADEILCFDGGTVVEQGTLSDLVEENGVFAKLYESQTGGETLYETR